jgi:uncharacterized membrane protein YgcG
MKELSPRVIRRVLVAAILGLLAAAAPLPGACNTYIRDDLNVLRADTTTAIQRRNADLIARTGACVDVLTLAAEPAGDNGKYALDTALAFGNQCSLGAVIVVTQTGANIRFEDASAGIKSSWQSITDDLGKGIESGDTSLAVMNTVNAIADGIIANPAPTAPPIAYASPAPSPGVADAITGLIAANWQSGGGRIAIIAACLLALFFLVKSLGLGRER